MKITTVNTIVLLCLGVLFYRPIYALSEGGPVDLLIRGSLLGYPIIYEKQTWVFDPDVALRRRKQFVAEYGDKGERLVEKLGLGIDGYEEQRLKKYRERDEGHLGGLNAYLP